MIRKIINFFEEHIETIIMGIVGLVCLWLLLFRVLFSPNVVTYDDRKFSPGAVDGYISRQADLLGQKVTQPPTRVEPNKPKVTEFAAMLDSAIRTVDVRAHFPQPYISSVVPAHADRQYGLPNIGEVNNAVAEHIRAVAYVPIVEVTEQNPYDKAQNEPNDIDLVTVEAKFDAAGLCRRFNESFAGEDVPVEWRDPCLARPVFAAVQLQRQELNPDGTWSEWAVVPRTKIDHFKRLFETTQNAYLPGNRSGPLGGVKLQLVQFDNRDVMMDLLQPAAYQIASANEEWLPPSLHKKYVQLRQQQEAEEKRQAQEQEKKAREGKLEERRAGTAEGLGTEGTGGTYYGERGVTDALGGGRTRPRRTTSDRLVEGGLPSESGRLRDAGRSRDTRLRDSGGLTGTGTTRLRGERDERDLDRERLAKAKEISTKQSMNELYTELNKILITLRTDLSKIRELLVFWAHDDTVESMKTYRYRIRLGVFNPAAASKSAKSPAASAILWSEFSSPTEAVEIPGVLYLFAKNLQEAARTVTVQVSRYTMGYWRSKDFAVRQGELIGKVVESEPEQTKLTKGTPLTKGVPPTYGMETLPFAEGGPALEPETIDFSTGAVLVDVTPVSDWATGKNMLARRYFDMLYSFDGTNIEHMPIDMKYWGMETRTAYAQIQTLQKEPREPLKAWGARGTGPRQMIVPGAGYRGGRGEEDVMMMEEMMREEMRMREQRGGRY
jgi:hypothetical protein